MDLKLVENLLNLISESEVDEVSIEEGDFKIKVKKKAEQEASQQPAYPPMPAQYNLPAAPQQPAAPAQPNQQQPVAQSSGSGEEETKSASGETIVSPIVGTFYRSPSPEDDPFVKVGDHVEKGQTVCIVEAMKIMNEIESEFSGNISKILVEDGQPVEYDQPLFSIETE